MKKIYLIASMFSLVLFSCTKENDAAEFVQKTTDAHKIEYSETTVPDTDGDINIVFNIDSKTEGVLFYAISGEKMATPDAYQLISDNVDALNSGQFDVTDASHVYNVRVPGYPKYYVYSVIRDVNDAITPVVVDTVAVGDITSPVLIPEYSSPVSGSETTLSPIIELTFSEPVDFGDSFKMEITGMVLQEDDLPIVSGAINITKDMVSIESNIVKIDLSRKTLICGNINFLTASEGSFVDQAGNPSKSIAWAHDGDDFTRKDYYFKSKNFDINPIMTNFIGVNNVNEVLGGKVISGYQFDVKLQECSESTVLLGDIFGVHPDLPFEFDLEKGVIYFNQFETAVYFDDEEQSFKIGTPEGNNQHRVYYRPIQVNADGGVGEYDAVKKSFYVNYEIYIDLLGSAGEVMAIYSKDAVATTSSYKASAASTSNVGTNYFEMIKQFQKENLK